MLASKPEILLTGLAFGESPRWHDGRLWVADWGPQEIIAVDRHGARETTVQLHFGSFQPICFDWLRDGRLTVVSSQDTKLLCQQSNGALVAYADLSSISRGWNEVVVDGRGNAYVNAIGFDMMAGAPFAPGFVALVTPDGRVRQVVEGLAFPNGMAVTPDNSTLIVAESYGKRLTAFEIGGDGSLSNRRTWADLRDGVPDGICIDAEGAVWYADVPTRRCVRVREGGEVLQSVELDRGGFACMLGGSEGRTLFIVAREWRGIASATDTARTGQVLSTSAPAPHAGWP